MALAYNRQNPMSDIPEASLNESLKIIEYYFTSEWLKNEQGTHPLQILWNRKDNLATIELFTFGNALMTMKHINETWVKGQLKLIKQTDINNRRGAFNEIIVLSSFYNDHIKVEPAKQSQKGYDGKVILQNNNELIISLKSYGVSEKNKKFNELAQDTERILLAHMLKLGIPSLQVIIEAIDEYPEEKDWNLLKSSIPDILNQYKASGQSQGYGTVGNKFNVALAAMEDSSLDPLQCSHTFIAIAPYHKNEERNLLSKIKEAHLNLTKHIEAIKGKTNILFIRVPLSVSIQSCKEWTENYYTNTPETTVKCVIFYQPAVTTNINDNSNILCHSIGHVLNPKYLEDIIEDVNNIEVTFPVGAISQESSHQILKIGNESIDLKSKYIYQGGRHFRKGRINTSGNQEGDIRKLAPGIFEHSILEVPGGKLVLKGIFEPSDDLLIL